MFAIKILLWTMAYSLGVARLSLTLVVLIRKKRPVDFWNAAFQSVFVLLILCLTDLEVVSEFGSEQVRLFSVSAAYLCTLLTITLPLFMHHKVGFQGLGLRRNRVFLWLGFALAGALTLEYAGLSPLPEKTAVRTVLAVTLASALYANGLRHYHNRINRRPRKEMGKATLLAVLLVPLIGWIDFRHNQWAGYIVTPLFYSLLSVTLLRSDYDSLKASSPVRNVPSKSADRWDLTKREKETALLLIEGLTYREIAEKLFISVQTVKTHANRIYGKTGCRSKIELSKRLNAPEDPSEPLQ